MKNPTKGERKMGKRLWAYGLLGMLTTIVVLAFARLSYGIILPFMRDSLNLSYKEAGYLGTTTSLGYLCTLIFAGMLATKWSGKRTILLGISLVTIGLTGLAFTPSALLAFLFMLMLGIGTSFTYTPLISLLVAWFPKMKGLVIGVTTSGTGVGILTAGMLVPFLSSLYNGMGWRIAWGIFAAIGFIVILLSVCLIKNPPGVQISGRMPEKVSAKEIYWNRKIINIGIIYGVIGITYIVQMIFIMSFMLESGISPKFAGQLIAINGILSIFNGPIWGAVSDHIGRRMSLIITMGLTLVSMFIPVVFPTYVGFSLHIILLSCTTTGLFTLTQASSMDHVKPAEMPIAFSYVTFYFAVGQLIGPAIAGWLIEEAGGFKSVFLFCSICLVFGLLFTFKVKNPVQNQISLSPIETKQVT